MCSAEMPGAPTIIAGLLLGLDQLLARMGMLMILPVKMMAKVLRASTLFVHAIGRCHCPTELKWQNDEHEDGNPAAHGGKYIDV